MGRRLQIGPNSRIVRIALGPLPCLTDEARGVIRETFKFVSGLRQLAALGGLGRDGSFTSRHSHEAPSRRGHCPVSRTGRRRGCAWTRRRGGCCGGRLCGVSCSSGSSCAPSRWVHLISFWSQHKKGSFRSSSTCLLEAVPYV